MVKEDFLDEERELKVREFFPPSLPSLSGLKWPQPARLVVKSVGYLGETRSVVHQSGFCHRNKWVQKRKLGSDIRTNLQNVKISQLFYCVSSCDQVHPPRNGIFYSGGRFFPALWDQ